MTGTSIILPDLSLAQADVLASLWSPEDVAPLLVSEFALGGSSALSLVNHAAPTSGLAAVIAGVASLTVANAGSGGTPGTYNLIFSGGGGTGAAGTVTVGAGGTISSVSLSAAGKDYASAPSISLANATGLTGGSVTAALKTPTYNANSIIVSNGSASSGPYGIDLGLIPTETDQTWMLIAKKPSTGSGLIAGMTGLLGFYYGQVANQLGFYNGQSGTSPAVPHVAFASATNFNVFIGWGSAGGVGHLRVGNAGALGSSVDGTVAGGARPSSGHVALGSTASGNVAAEVAFFARVNGILTDAQQLAWYLSVRARATALGLTVA